MLKNKDKAEAEGAPNPLTRVYLISDPEFKLAAFLEQTKEGTNFTFTLPDGKKFYQRFRMELENGRVKDIHWHDPKKTPAESAKSLLEQQKNSVER